MSIIEHIMNMRGIILLDEVDKSPYYLSTDEMRRYYAEFLGFKGSAEEFIESCRECPPDKKESYTEVTGLWKPTFCKRYQTERHFVAGTNHLQSD